VAVKPNLENLPTEDHWVLGTHNEDLLEDCPEDVIKIGVHREMLGHLLSYFNHPDNPNSDEFVETVRQSDFFHSRETFLNLDVNYFSYDKIAKKNETEINRMSKLVGVPIKLESYTNAVKALGLEMFRNGDPDRWGRVFSEETKKNLICMSENHLLLKEKGDNCGT